MARILLIIEKTEDGYLGRVNYQGNLIVTEESSLGKVQVRMKNLLIEFHGIDKETILFKERYDLSSLFEKFDYLKISNVAKIAGINDSLLRQYVTGNKQASKNQAKKIEKTIRKIGKDLSSVQVYSTIGAKN